MSKILIIDDEDLVRDTVKQLLAAVGHDVVEARNGKEGVAQFGAIHPDLVISDIIMPDKEGLATITEIRQADPEVRILAMSGGGRLGNMDFLQMAQKLGANRIIAKPFDPDELLDVVDEMLRR